MGIPINSRAGQDVLRALAEGRATATGVPALAPPAPPPDCSEEDFQADVVKYALGRGWEYYHTHDSRRSPEGFPDLVLARERVVYVELKSATGRVTDKQDHWQSVLKRAGQETYVLWPTDWPLVLEVLK